MKKKTFVYNYNDFKKIMEGLGLNDGNVEKEKKISVISISSYYPKEERNEENSYYEEPYFKEDHDNVINLVFDDIEPDDFFTDEEVIDFEGLYDYNGSMLQFFSDSMARKVVNFVDRRIEETDMFVIHCSAGVSRSQAVSRFLIDMYNYEWIENPYNTCRFPNAHVLRLLKRTKRLKNEKNMTKREKQFYEAAKNRTFPHLNIEEFENHKDSMEAFVVETLMKMAFVEGARWADKNPPNKTHNIVNPVIWDDLKKPNSYTITYSKPHGKTCTYGTYDTPEKCEDVISQIIQANQGLKRRYFDIVAKNLEYQGPKC